MSSGSLMKEKGITSERTVLSEDESQKRIQDIYADQEYVTLGPHTYRRQDIQDLFERLQPLSKPDEGRVSTVRKFANPVPLGLASFSLSCLTLSLVNANVRGVTNLKFLISLFMFFGGAIELFAGLLCFVAGDTFCMTVFSSFGGFWISWGCINTDQFHSISAYGNDTKMFDNITGFFLAGWTVFTFLMLLCSMKSTWGIFLLLATLEMTFLLLTIGCFIDNNKVKMAGGYFGIVSSCCGWYSLYCMVSTPENTYFNLDATVMPNALV